MATKRLSEKALYVDRGYGQVEPNHLSAQRTGQIYAQLPANAEIDLLENGQFEKYNYAPGEVDFKGKGEWMLVYNEVKVYYDHQADHDFAMKKENYNARVYAPVDADSRTTGHSRDYSEFAQAGIAMDGTANPFEVETFTGAKMMPKGSTMVPRVLKTNVGDIFTTNTIATATAETELAVGNLLAPRAADGYLEVVEEGTEGMLWEVVKVYTMPDRQRGVKIVRIA